MSKYKFRVWHVSLPIMLGALAVFAWFMIDTFAMMDRAENPFGAIGMLMVYAYYWGVALIVAGIAFIVTIVSAIAKK